MEEICISGGGPKGIAYLGALHELYNMGLLNNVKVYSGASIGSFFIVLLNIGYNPEDIITKLFHYNFEELKDMDIMGIFHNVSIMRGEKFRDFVYNMIKVKIDPTTTLKTLYEKTKTKIIVSVLCVDEGVVKYMSHENEPDISIFKLVCMSTSIPLIFPPVKYNGNYYADGGIIDNLPIKVLKKDSWGITSISREYTKEKYTFLSYIMKILYIVYSTLQDKLNEEYINVIRIDTKHISVTSFNLTYDEKKMLIEKGRESVNTNKEKILKSLQNPLQDERDPN